MPKRNRGFTLIELLVVIGIIGLLLSILLPTLSKVRQKSETVACLSNLQQLGAATNMYLNDSKQRLPYPTTTLGEGVLWYNVLDPYLGQISNINRTGVAAGRQYTPYKQCRVWKTFDGGRFAGAQDTMREYAKTYKMNSHLRLVDPVRAIGISRITEPTNTVYLGDGISLDMTGPVDNQWESGQFSMEVNDKTQATPALRHDGGANILFLDFHAEHVRLKKFEKKLRSPNQDLVADCWESEFVNSAGTPVDVPDGKKTAEEQGLTRNPNMPLRWSNPGVYYRP